MSNIPKTRLEEQSSTSSVEMKKSKTEKLMSLPQSKFPLMSPKLPFRMLQDLDEDSWLSGSELKTDNSTSEDEEVHRSFGGSKTKLRSKGRKNMSTIRKVMTFSSSSGSSTSKATCSTTTSKSYQSKSSFASHEDGSEELQELVRKTSLSSSTGQRKNSSQETDTKAQEKEWRPKRGSISLPGMNEQMEINRD